MISCGHFVLHRIKQNMLLADPSTHCRIVQTVRVLATDNEPVVFVKSLFLLQ